MTKTATTLGNKYTCNACKSRFYDLNKEPPTCPTCDHVYVAPKPVVKVRRVARG